MVDHVRQVARREGRRGPRAEIAFGDGDHLDLDAGLGGEVGGHGLLPFQPLGLFLGGPEADRVPRRRRGQRQHRGRRHQGHAARGFDRRHAYPPIGFLSGKCRGCGPGRRLLRRSGTTVNRRSDSRGIRRAGTTRRSSSGARRGCAKSASRPARARRAGIHGIGGQRRVGGGRLGAAVIGDDGEVAAHPRPPAARRGRGPAPRRRARRPPPSAAPRGRAASAPRWRRPRR
jgi:hypothetical protein